MSDRRIAVLFISTAITFLLIGMVIEKYSLEKNIQAQNLNQNTVNKNQPDIKQETDIEAKSNPSNPSVSREEAQKQFAQDVYKKLPNTYVLKNVDYYESIDDTDSDAIKALEISPCEPKDGDNWDIKPFCFTSITIFAEKDKTDNLEEYITSNWLMSEWNKGGAAWDAGLIRTKYENSVPMTFTPQRFMCIGTGGGGCMRERYAYHMPSGYNIVAEISLWPDYNDMDGTGQNGDLEHNKMWDLYYEYEKVLGNS